MPDIGRGNNLREKYLIQRAQKLCLVYIDILDFFFDILFLIRQKVKKLPFSLDI